jgi:hypothetical protein
VTFVLAKIDPAKVRPVADVKANDVPLATSIDGVTNAGDVDSTTLPVPVEVVVPVPPRLTATVVPFHVAEVIEPA